jgi:hypothetical protein
VSYSTDIEFLVIDMRFRFREINDDEKLTEADKKQLKDFFLQHMIAPKARKMLEQHLAEEETRRQRTSRPHQDRH